ncbi:hypothetical protein HYD94_00830 [Mycoplasmopsis bovis]|nr:hypothetical protein [Mycoplasmopsis bovis]QQH34855.1 hypothetical protein HYD94_00830 [Mycoplasmopsis bovis]
MNQLTFAKLAFNPDVDIETEHWDYKIVLNRNEAEEIYERIWAFRMF